MGTHKSWHIKFSVILSNSCFIKAGQSNPIWGIGLQEPPKAAWAPNAKVPQVDQTTHLSHVCRGPKLVPCKFPGCCFNFCEFLWARLVIFFLCDVFHPSGFYSPYFLSSAGFPKVGPMFVDTFLHVFPSVNGKRLSDILWYHKCGNHYW